MKHSALLLLLAVPCFIPLAPGKEKNPADYPLVVHVLASSRETQLVYRGTDCTSSAYGEIDETDTPTARVYTTCSPNWAAYRYAFAEFDVTNTDPTVNNTARVLGQCANASGVARASSIIGGLGNAMAAAGGTPDQRAQAEQNSRRAQPVPPAAKCNVVPGDYRGRWQKGKLELLAYENGKQITVSFVVSVVTVKQDTRQDIPTAQPISSSSQDCPNGMTRIPTSYGSYCGTQIQAAEERRRAEEQQSKLPERVYACDYCGSAVAAQSLPPDCRTSPTCELHSGQVMAYPLPSSKLYRANVGGIAENCMSVSPTELYCTVGSLVSDNASSGEGFHALIAAQGDQEYLIGCELYNYTQGDWTCADLSPGHWYTVVVHEGTVSVLDSGISRINSQTGKSLGAISPVFTILTRTK